MKGCCTIKLDLINGYRKRKEEKFPSVKNSIIYFDVFP